MSGGPSEANREEHPAAAEAEDWLFLWSPLAPTRVRTEQLLVEHARVVHTGIFEHVEQAEHCLVGDEPSEGSQVFLRHTRGKTALESVTCVGEGTIRSLLALRYEPWYPLLVDVRVDQRLPDLSEELTTSSHASRPLVTDDTSFEVVEQLSLVLEESWAFSMAASVGSNRRSRCTAREGRTRNLRGPLAP